MAHTFAERSGASARNNPLTAKQMINSLQVLRGVFAIFIFLCHYSIGLSDIMPCGGDCGVAFFMMLSGFVLSAGYEAKLRDRRISYRDFISRRVSKIYPLHILCFIYAILLFRYAFTPKSAAIAALNVSMLQSWIPLPEFYFSFNAVSWFLSDIMFFYLLFPLLVGKRLIYNNRFLVGFALYIILYLGVITHISDELLNSIAYILPLSRLIDFIFGMLLWRLYTHVRNSGKQLLLNNMPSSVRIAVRLAAIAILCLWIWLYGRIDPAFKLAAFWWPCMALIIISFALSERDSRETDGEKPRINVLITKVLTAFANLSYTFYMIHVLGISTFKLIIRKTAIEYNPWLMLVIVFISIVIVSVIIDYTLKRLKWTRSR